MRKQTIGETHQRVIVCLERFPWKTHEWEIVYLSVSLQETHKQEIVYEVNNYVNNYGKQLSKRFTVVGDTGSDFDHPADNPFVTSIDG